MYVDVNNSPSRRLGGRAPITVHTGMPSGNPLTVVLTAWNVRNVQSFSQAQPLQKRNINLRLNSLDKIHKDVGDSLSDTRRKYVKRHNKKTHVVPYKSIVADKDS